MSFLWRNVFTLTVNGLKATPAPCTCQAKGDPHFTTCDGRRFDYMGKCVYVTAETCGDLGDLPAFKIEERHEDYVHNRRAATTKELYITFGGDVSVINIQNISFSEPLPLWGYLPSLLVFCSVFIHFTFLIWRKLQKE